MIDKRNNNVLTKIKISIDIDKINHSRDSKYFKKYIYCNKITIFIIKYI